MRIFRLQVENVKNLKAIDITPQADGSAVVIRGKNGAGKSAVLDSIAMAITGKKIERPIRQGESDAAVTVTLDDYVVTRTWTKKSGSAGYLNVQTKEGAAVKSPQALLNKIKGQIGFDPLEFATYTGKRRTEVLKSLDPALDFEQHDADRQKIYDERTLVNRDLRNVEGELAGLPVPPGDLPAEATSPASAAKHFQSLTEQVQQYNQWCVEFEAARKGYESLLADKTRITGQIAELQGTLQGVEAAMAEAIDNGRDLEGLKPYCPNEDALSSAKTAIDDAEATGEAVRNARAYTEKKARLGELAEEAADLTQLLEEGDQQKAKAIAEAKYPIDGLAIDAEAEDCTFDGILFDQLASSEQIRVSTAIGMALNPELRVLTVHDGSLLDDEGQKTLRATTLENEYQLWEEVVGVGGVGIILEAGEIKEIRK